MRIFIKNKTAITQLEKDILKMTKHRTKCYLSIFYYVRALQLF